MRKDLSNNAKLLIREERLKKFKYKPPHDIFYDENTIKWFQNRYPETIIKKSIYSLLPNNGAQMLKEEQTPLNRIMQWLATYCQPKDKFNNLCINPKYFFSKEILNKILKLKEIFLQFDEDGSRKMEIDEMVTMFQTNHIEVTEDELCSLFFKGKKYRKQDIDKLYLDFYQFMQFALNKKSDQDFRVFMRRIKEKIMKEQREKTIKAKEKEEILQFHEGQSEEDMDNEDINNVLIDENNILNNDEKNEPIFLPMNFNLVLDYFINKGKERKSQKKIRRAIKLMRNILNPGTYPPDDKDIVTEDENEEEDRKKEEPKAKEQENEFDKQLKDINTESLMEEFSKLFKMSYTTSHDIQKDNLRQLKKRFSKSITINTNEYRHTQEGRESTVDSRFNKKYNTQKVEMQFQFNDSQNKKKEKKMIFTEMIKNSLSNRTETEMNILNYNKFKNVKLAKEETSRFFSSTKPKSSHPYNLHPNFKLLQKPKCSQSKQKRIEALPLITSGSIPIKPAKAFPNRYANVVTR